MPESRELQEFKQTVSDNLGIYTARTTAESSGLSALLKEGRESTFELSTTKKDGKSILTTPGPFGNAEFATNPQLDSLDAQVDFKSNKLVVGGNVHNSYTDVKDASGKVAGTEDMRISASMSLDDLIKSQSQGSLDFSMSDSLKDESGKVVFTQQADCKVNVKTRNADPVDAVCVGKITDESGKQFDFTSKESIMGSSIEVKSDGKTIGTVDTENSPAANGVDINYKVHVKPAG